MVEEIKRLCVERKVSILEVEKACNLGSRTIYRWDEKIPSVDKVQRVANFFGVTVDNLINPGVTSSEKKRHT